MVPTSASRSAVEIGDFFPGHLPGLGMMKAPSCRRLSSQSWRDLIIWPDTSRSLKCLMAKNTLFPPLDPSTDTSFWIQLMILCLLSQFFPDLVDDFAWEPVVGAEECHFIPVVARISWICEGQHCNRFQHQSALSSYSNFTNLFLVCCVVESESEWRHLILEPLDI